MSDGADLMPYVVAYGLNPGFMATCIGIFSAGVTAYVAHHVQTRRSRVLPYLPSHLDSLEQRATEATRFYAAVHEMCMAVTEAWNTARARRQNKGSVETVIKLEALLPACQSVKLEAAALRELLVGYHTLCQHMVRAQDALESAWTYECQHNYTTEYVTEVSDGRRRETAKQVYDSTDHWFRLDKSAAKRAEKHTKAFADLLERSHLPVVDLGDHRVDIENIDDAERMFLRRLIQHTLLDGDGSVDDAKVTHYVNQWIVGPRIAAQLGSFRAGSEALAGMLGEHTEQMRSSEAEYHWCTARRTHEGPRGFQAATRLSAELEQARIPWEAFSETLRTCVDVADELSAWAQDRSVIESDQQYARSAVRAYEAAFPDSAIEVNQLPTAKSTVIWSLAVGGAATLLVLVVHPDALMSLLSG